MRDLQAHLDLDSVYERHIGSIGFLQCLNETCRLSWISIVLKRDRQAQLDLQSVYARPLGSVGSLQSFCETCRLSLISIVCMRDLQAQLDLYSVIRDPLAQLDLDSVYARPVSSVGSLQCLYETCRLSYFSRVFMRDQQALLDLYSLFCEKCRLSLISIVCMRDLLAQLDLYSFIRDLQAHLDLDSVYARHVGSL